MSERVNDLIKTSHGFADPNALVERGRQAADANDLEGALKDADDALDRETNHYPALVLKVTVLAGLGRTDDAFKFLRQVSAGASDAKILRFARTFAQDQGRPDEALDHAFRLTEIEPQDEKNRAFVGQQFLNLNAPESALVQSQKMIADGSVKLGPMLKAQALAKLDRRDEALKTLRECLLGQGDDPKLLRMARTIALESGHPREATDYALRLSAFEPNHAGNQISLIHCCLAGGEFGRALEHADRLVAQHPREVDGPLLQAQALVALHRVPEALNGLDRAIQAEPKSAKLLRTARTIAYQNGRFESVIEYSRRLLDIAPEEEATHVFLVQAYIALGRIEEAEAHLKEYGSNKKFRLLGKSSFHLRHSRQVEETVPAFVRAWRAALDNIAPPNVTSSRNSAQALMIQYWSQGELPHDVALVHKSWRDLFDREQLGRVELFDRNSAAAWITAHAPEFSSVFAQSFHYAMESDIFRIAYASKRQCVYMDIDSWPLQDSAAIIRFATRAAGTMLYCRSYRPWVVNGSFVSTPDSAFIRELVSQTLTLRLEDLPKNHETIELSFGPTRYNMVLTDLLKRRPDAKVGKAGAPGCSSLALENEKLYFTHEAALASVKPPFSLGYKATDDYWKWVSIPA